MTDLYFSKLTKSIAEAHCTYDGTTLKVVESYGVQLEVMVDGADKYLRLLNLAPNKMYLITGGGKTVDQIVTPPLPGLLSKPEFAAAPWAVAFLMPTSQGGPMIPEEFYLRVDEVV